MEIIKDRKPLIYEKCVEQFGVNWEDGVIFTYGNEIFCKYNLPPIKLIHEMTHIRQQGNNPKEWWDKYFEDKEFRLEQEKEAYLNESKWLKENVKDRNQRFTVIYKNAKDLSSSMYGNIISFSEALNFLK